MEHIEGTRQPRTYVRMEQPGSVRSARQLRQQIHQPAAVAATAPAPSASMLRPPTGVRHVGQALPLALQLLLQLRQPRLHPLQLSLDLLAPFNQRRPLLRLQLALQPTGQGADGGARWHCSPHFTQPRSFCCVAVLGACWQMTDSTGSASGAQRRAGNKQQKHGMPQMDNGIQVAKLANSKRWVTGSQQQKAQAAI